CARAQTAGRRAIPSILLAACPERSCEGWLSRAPVLDQGEGSRVNRRQQRKQDRWPLNRRRKKNFHDCRIVPGAADGSALSRSATITEFQSSDKTCSPDLCSPRHEPQCRDKLGTEC